MGVRSAGDRLAGSATSASSSSSSGSTSPNHTRLFLNAPANYLTYLPSHRLPLSSGRGSGLPTGLPAPVGGSAQHLRTSALGGAGKHYGGTGRRSHGTGTGNHRLSWFARCNMRRCPNHGAPSGRFTGAPPWGSPDPPDPPGHPPGVPRTPPDPPGHPPGVPRTPPDPPGHPPGVPRTP